MTARKKGSASTTPNRVKTTALLLEREGVIAAQSEVLHNLRKLVIEQRNVIKELSDTAAIRAKMIRSLERQLETAKEVIELQRRKIAVAHNRPAMERN
jgi:hypothetical protein